MVHIAEGSGEVVVPEVDAIATGGGGAVTEHERFVAVAPLRSGVSSGAVGEG